MHGEITVTLFKISMQLVKRIFLVLFVLVSLGDLLAIAVDVQNLQHIFKPLILVMLGGYYFTSLNPGTRSALVVLAIVFSFLGDTFLMYEYKRSIYFMFGLGSFLLAHVFYILVYRQHQTADTSNQLAGVHRLRLAMPIVLAGSGLIIVLTPRLGDLQIPVVLYALVLVVMVLMALFRYGRTSSLSFWFVFAGAVLFMISDSLLAINKFLTPLAHAGLWIMFTYITAQYLIIRGLIEHDYPKR